MGYLHYKNGETQKTETVKNISYKTSGNAQFLRTARSDFFIFY